MYKLTIKTYQINLCYHDNNQISMATIIVYIHVYVFFFTLLGINVGVFVSHFMH